MSIEHCMPMSNQASASEPAAVRLQLSGKRFDVIPNHFLFNGSEKQIPRT